jgi:hypothetical protein
VVRLLQVSVFELIALTAMLPGCIKSQTAGERHAAVDNGNAATGTIVPSVKCNLPANLTSGAAASSSQEDMIQLCKPGKTTALISVAAAWFKAAPADPAAASWLSQALYIRALESDGLRSPCAPDPLFIDHGPPCDGAEAVLYVANQNAQIGWDHIIRSPDSRRDAEASLCLAETALASRFDSTVFRRRVRILMDLGRDAELRRAIKEINGFPDRVPGGVAKWFAAYVPDYLGVGREIEAGELTLLLRELDPDAAPHLDPFRRAIVLQSRRRYQPGTAERQRVEAWIANHGFDTTWAPSAPLDRSRRRP